MIEPIEVLKGKLKSKSQRQLAEELGLSASYIADVVHRRRPPSERLLDALGLEMVYRRKRKA